MRHVQIRREVAEANAKHFVTSALEEHRQYKTRRAEFDEVAEVIVDIWPRSVSELVADRRQARKELLSRIRQHDRMRRKGWIWWLWIGMRIAMILLDIFMRYWYPTEPTQAVSIVV